MGEKLHRTQVLIEPEQHEALSNIAAQEQRSISEIVRDMLREYLAKRSSDLRWQRREKALEGARLLRERIRAAHGGQPLDADIEALMSELREERSEQLFATFPEHDDEGRD